MMPSRRTAWLLAGALVTAQVQAQAPGAARWWPGFIDTRGKAFLELPEDARLCAAARDAVRKAAVEPGRVVLLPHKAEALVPAGARLVFGVVDGANSASERVFTRIVTIARGSDKGACAYLAEAGAEAAGAAIEEDRSAIGVYPPRRVSVKPPDESWKSYGLANTSGTATDARFAPPGDAPAAWRARIVPLLGEPAELFGHTFHAVLAPGQPPTALALVGAIANSAAPGPTYNTVNLIVGMTPDGTAAGTLYQAGPSGGIERNRSGSFAAQVMLVADLDGDGVDEVILAARYYAGGNLKVLKFTNGRFTEVRQTAYEGE
jgi:hypothetical protein